MKLATNIAKLYYLNKTQMKEKKTASDIQGARKEDEKKSSIIAGKTLNILMNTHLSLSRRRRKRVRIIRTKKPRRGPRRGIKMREIRGSKFSKGVKS